MANKMLIDATHPEETRVVVLRGNRVEEFDFETAHRKQLRGNIYLAKVTRVEPSLQAAFVDYGGNRHGFLAFSEIHPDYYQIPVADRQALLEDEARAARDEEEEDNRGSRRRGGRHRQRNSRRRDESMRGHAPAEGQAAEASGEQPFVADDVAHDHAETPAGEHAGSDAPTEVTSERAAEAHDQAPFEAAPVGESANPPVAAEAAAPIPEQIAEAGQDRHHDDHAHDDHPHHDHAHHEHDDHAHDHEHHHEPDTEGGAPVEGHDASAHPADGEAHSADGEAHDDEHHDEEEEVVDTVGGADALEEVQERTPRYRRQYKIQEVIKRRQIMLVQVVKEERGTKGAALTTYLSLAGRYCVLMPNTARGGGISRKITSAEDRRKLREIADELEVPEGMGVILRTAGAARTKQEVKRDFEYLLRTWEQVRDLTLKSTAPTLVYEEGSLTKRSIRDLYSKDIEEVVVAGETGYRDAKEFMRMLIPSHAKNVKLYRDTQPVFTRYGIESQLDAMFSPTVQLKSGGYIVINQTEALVAIDVNSGRSTREHHIEDTALKTNCEAAEEVARQLRLRDLAGLIVIDFIDMDEKRNNRTVERRLKEALRHDRARIQVGRISHFGLLEMSRQRIRTSVLESSTEKCPHCGGTGHVRSVSSVALQLLRGIEDTLQKSGTHNLIVRTRPEIAIYVLNHKRAHLGSLEQRYHVTITVNADAEIEGTVSFAIDRGEQVMTPEQARQLAAQHEGPVLLHEDEEPDYIEETEDESTETSAEFTGSENVVEVADDEESPGAEEAAADAVQESGREGGHDNGRDGRGRRRRRRRGRGGRGGEGRGDFQGDRNGERAPREGGEQPYAAQGAYGEDPMPDPSHAPEGDFHPTESMPAGGEGDFAPREGGDRNGNGDPRRRRRGRRGGRRNRRERGDGAPMLDHDVSSQQSEGDFAPPAPQGWQDRLPAQPAEMTDVGSVQRSEAVAPPEPQPAPTAAAPAEAPQRRRSTVREAAPIGGGIELPPTPVPPAQSEPAPVVTSSASDEAKPRKTGWWAKKFLGKD
jgi:ribonuclease E